MNQYRDLISANTIVVVPFAAPRDVSLDHAATSAVTDPHIAELFPPLPDTWWGFPLEHIAAMDIARQLATYDGALEPYLPTAGHVADFRQLASAADESIRKALGSHSPHGYNALSPES